MKGKRKVRLRWEGVRKQLDMRQGAEYRLGTGQGSVAYKGVKGWVKFRRGGEENGT